MISPFKFGVGGLLEGLLELLLVEWKDSLLQIGPFVPVPKGYLSRFWNRDKAAGIKALEAFVPGGRTGTKCPSR